MLHELLVRFRVANSLTASQIAEKGGWGKSSVSKWESGASIPRNDSWPEIEKAYGMPPGSISRQMALDKRGCTPAGFSFPSPSDIAFQALVERIMRYLQQTGLYSPNGIDIFTDSLMLLPDWSAWKTQQKNTPGTDNTFPGSGYRKAVNHATE